MKLWLRHPGKFAETRDDGLKVGDLRQQGRRALTKHFIELFRTLLPRPYQVLHRQLQWKQRILELMRQTAGQLPPGSHALGLYHALSLLQQFSRHAIERFGQRSQFVRRIHWNPRVPVSGGHFSRRFRELFDRPRDPGEAHPLNTMARIMPTVPATRAAERMRFRNST